ncbi:MAG: ankyrin repeat domain-containing protein [Gammaproteobacteria bacterium]|nr:ankyrin repeat domain-containing protein [Gammaproteobacteria bacterium]
MRERMREKEMRAGAGRSGGAGALVAALALTLLVSAATPPESPVADAAMRGDHGSVRALLQQGADVNAAQGDGMTALHWAADRGDLEMARMLVYAGAGLEAVTRMAEYTPLHLASRAGHGAVVRALLEAGSDPAARTGSGGATPLHLAATAGDAEAVAVLIEHGADVDAREERARQTPLIFAAAQNRVEAIRALLAGGADLSLATTVVDMVELEESLRGGEQDRVRQQINAQLAARAAQEQKEEGEEEEKPPEAPKPLSMGQQVGHMGGMTALLHAARQGHAGAVEALLDAGADIDQVSADGTTPIFIAALNGHFDMVLALLERGADPNLANHANGTPLFATINQQWIPKTGYAQPNVHLQQNATHMEVMQALLRAGADPNARLSKRLWFTQYGGSILSVNMIGATPFWRASYAADVAAMRLLVAYGADHRVPTQRPPARRRIAWDEDPGADKSGIPAVPVGGPGIYPIHAASGVGYGQGFAANAHRHAPDGWMPAMRYLVDELGADVNLRDHDAYNALHHAASRGDTEMIRFLVERGADVMAISRIGQTTADMANGPYQRTTPYPDAIALLESFGSLNNNNCQSC